MGRKTHSQRKAWFSFETFAYGAAVSALWAGAVVLIPGISDEFRLPKLALSEALFLLSVVFLAASKEGLGGWRSSRRLLLTLTPLVAVALLSVVVGSHPDHGRIALWNFLIAVVVLLAWGTRPLTVERILSWLVVPAFAAATVILMQWLDLWQPLGIAASRSRLLLTGFIGNSGEASLYLALPVAVCVVRALRAWRQDRKVKKMVLWTAVALILVAGLVVTKTVTAFLLVVVCAACLIVFLSITRRTRWISVGLVIVALTGTLLSPTGSRVWKKIEEVKALDFQGLTTARTDGWKVALYLLRENPVLGVGFGAFGAEFTSGKEAELAAGRTFFRRHTGQSTFSNAHSEPLEWAAETGWFGVAALLLTLYMAGGRLKRRWPSAAVPDVDVRGRPLPEEEIAEEKFEIAVQRSLLVVVLVMLATMALTYFPFRTALLGYPFVLLVAALLGADREEPFREDARIPLSRHQGVRWLVVAGLVGLLCASLFVSKRRIQSSARLFVVEAAGSAMIQKNKIYPALLRPLMAPLAEAELDTPWDERISLALGTCHRLLREPEEAAAWYEKSIRIASRPETIFNLGRTHLALEEREQAVALLARAVLLDPLRQRAVPKELADAVRQEVAARQVDARKVGARKVGEAQQRTREKRSKQERKRGAGL